MENATLVYVAGLAQAYVVLIRLQNHTRNLKRIACIALRLPEFHVATSSVS